MTLDMGEVQSVVAEREDALRAAAEAEGWHPTGGGVAFSEKALGRLHKSVEDLGIVSEDELNEAISIDKVARAYLRDIADFARRNNWGSTLGAEPYDVAFVLLVRSRGEGLNLVHEKTFAHDSLHIAVNEALEKARSKA